MKANKILVPIDFSPCSSAALGLAASMARGTGAKLLLLHVHETPVMVDGGEYLGVPPAVLNSEARRDLEEVALPDPNVPCERYLKFGNPWEEIVRFAKEQQVDFIVMGTHGWRGLTRLLLGSIAEAVLRRAPCPVITLKHAAVTEQTAEKESAAMV